jgi:micrococcal nuclease
MTVKARRSWGQLVRASIVGSMFVAWPLAAAAQAPATAPAPATTAPTKAIEGLEFAEQPGWKAEKPSELFEIERVVDGDTLHIRRNGELQKLRLLSVDTEEKFSTNTGDASKPSTVFGEECAQWAMAFFKPTEARPDAARIGLKFPREVEERDVYGRVLCYAILPDGRNFNLLLVQLGKSPYFNKYGNSELCHDAFVEAQKLARTWKRGIWDPRTNKPKTPGAPVAERPYARLMPWWNARGAAVDEYRKARAQRPEHVAGAESPAELERVAATSAKGESVEVFGQIDRLFDESNGSQTLLMRSGAKEQSLRVRIAAADRPKFAALELSKRNDEGRQNYLWVKGSVTKGERGFELRCSDPAAIRTAGPEVVADASAAAKESAQPEPKSDGVR